MNRMTAAGWYPDPHTGQQRYFDGTDWGPVAPPPPPTPPLSPPASTPPPTRGASGRTIILVVVGLVVAIALIAQFGGGNDDDKPRSEPPSTTYVPTPTTPTYTTQDYQDAAISTCQKAIKQGLKDPDSAKFGDDWKAWKITSSSMPAGMEYDPVAGDLFFNASGSVNAKNSFGGYVGNELMYCDVVITKSGDVQARSRSVEDLLSPTPTP
jgi:hypothetical protein